LQEGEVIDCSVMNVKKLREFFETEIPKCKEADVLCSLHMKATMMKISDPIIFGHCVSIYYKDVFDKWGDKLAAIGVNPNLGIGDLEEKVKARFSEADRVECLADVQKCYETQPELAMVNSDKGITNLHYPNDIIIDASMPVVVRDSGKMWTPDDKLKDTHCLIPDRSYSGIYKAALDFCRENGQFDVSTMGHIPNVGLMAQKAEEYGSHDKTFECSGAGVMRVLDGEGTLLMEQAVEKGDIFRMCQTKDEPIKDWVKLAVTRARATGRLRCFGSMRSVPTTRKSSRRKTNTSRNMTRAGSIFELWPRLRPSSSPCSVQRMEKTRSLAQAMY